MKFDLEIIENKKGKSSVIEGAVYGLDVNIEYAITNNDWYVLYTNEDLRYLSKNSIYIIKKFTSIIGGKIFYKDKNFYITFGTIYDRDGCQWIPIIFDQECNDNNYYIKESINIGCWNNKVIFNYSEIELNSKLDNANLDIEFLIKRI